MILQHIALTTVHQLFSLIILRTITSIYGNSVFLGIPILKFRILIIQSYYCLFTANDAKLDKPSSTKSLLITK